MSFIAAAAPLEETPSDLKTASFPAQRAANEDSAEGCARQYEISASVKFLVTNVGLFDGTAEISSVGYRQFRPSDAGVIIKKRTLIDTNSGSRTVLRQELGNGLHLGNIRLLLGLQLGERVLARPWTQ